MSYMNDQAVFAPVGGILELSFDEVNEVGGGPGPLALLPVLVGAAKACSKSNTCKGVFVAAAGVAAAAVGYENNRV